MRFEIIDAQAQTLGLKSGSSTSDRPLMVFSK